jgi:hypothetical protein
MDLSRGLGDVYKRQAVHGVQNVCTQTHVASFLELVD